MKQLNGKTGLRRNCLDESFLINITQIPRIYKTF